MQEQAQSDKSQGGLGDSVTQRHPLPPRFRPLSPSSINLPANFAINYRERSHYESRKPWNYWLLLLAPLAGYAAYFGLMHLNTGNAFEGFDAQKAYPYSPSIKNMFNFAGLSEAFLNARSFDGMMDSLLDRALFVLLVLLLPLVWRLNRTWFFYTAAAGVVPALTSWFMSYRRYFLVCFPAFVILAQLSTKTRRWVFWYYVALLAALQVWGLKQFLTFNWAG